MQRHVPEHIVEDVRLRDVVEHSFDRIVTVVGNFRSASEAKNSRAGRNPPTGTALQPFAGEDGD